MVDKTMQYARYYRVTYASQDEFQVKDGFTTFVVNLGVRTYSCDYWALIGLPCKYPCACIAYKRADAEVYWDHFFSNVAYYETYAEIIYPMPKVDEFATSGFNVPIDHEDCKGFLEGLRGIEKEVLLRDLLGKEIQGDL